MNEREQRIESQYYNQQIDRELQGLKEKIGHSVDVVYIRDAAGMVKPESVRLVITEKDQGENMTLITNVQEQVRWWVEQAHGNVDFVDRSKLI